jgi:hypothetical protein
MSNHSAPPGNPGLPAHLAPGADSPGNLEGRLFLGGEVFVRQMAALAGDIAEAHEVPRGERRPRPLSMSLFVSDYADPKEGMARVYSTGDYTLAQVAQAFGAHYSTVRRAVRSPVGFEPSGTATQGSVRLARTVAVTPITGYTKSVKAGSMWQRVGVVPQGVVYRPVGDVFAIEGANMHEAYLVVAEGDLVGFYLPGEAAFSPLPERVPLPRDPAAGLSQAASKLDGAQARRRERRRRRRGPGMSLNGPTHGTWARRRRPRTGRLG